MKKCTSHPSFAMLTVTKPTDGCVDSIVCLEVVTVVQNLLR